MDPPSRAFADAAAAALRALQCSEPLLMSPPTTSGRRPARQARSAGAPAPIAAGAVSQAPAVPAGDPTLLPAASGTSVDPPPAPPSSPESAAEATETPSPAVPIEEAPDSPPTPPPSASAPPPPSPAPSVTLATRGVSVGSEAAVGAAVLGEQQMQEVALLVVGVARLPPARVNAALDRSLQAATNVGEVLAAAVAPVRLHLAESDELVNLRRDNDRLREELADTQNKLDEEMHLRQRADYLLVTANSDCNQALENLQDMRTELAHANQQLLGMNAAISQHGNITRSLEGRTQTAEADAAAAVRLNTQIHEHIKASLVVYNTQLEKLRKQLANRDRDNVIPARIRALTDENNSLRRANSILRRHSAAHGIDVDTLVLASAGISAAEIDRNLLGLSPPTVTVESPRRDESSSEEEEEPKTADVSMAERTEGSSAPAASEVASAGSSESTGTSNRKRDSQAESASAEGTASQPSPPKRFGRMSADLRARAAAAAASSSPRSASGKVPAPTPSMPRPSTTCRTSRLDAQPLPYEHSNVPLYPRLAGAAPVPQPARSQPPRDEGPPDFVFGGAGSPDDVTQDELKPGEIPDAPVGTEEAEGSASAAPATTTESPPAVPVPEAASIVSQASVSVGPMGNAPGESPAGDNEGPSASRSSPSAPPMRTAAVPGDSSPPGGSPEGGSSDGSETSEDCAALMREMFGSDDEEEEASAAQRTGPAAPPAPQPMATEVPVAAQAAPAALSQPYTRSTLVHAHALVTATVTATPRAGPASIAPAVVDASDAAAGSRKLNNLASRFLEPGFVSPGGQEYGIEAFGKWENLAHPFQVLRQLFPDPYLIDFQGNSFHPNEKGDLGLALWERRHLIRAKAVKAFIDNLAATLGHRNPVVMKLRKEWAKYYKKRSYRADRLRDRMVNKLWVGCIEYDGQPYQHPTEVLLEPSYMQYSFEVMEWIPTTDGWISEIAELDAREPWRNRWFQDPASHPYNTAFAPCNDVPLFVPRGMTREAVATSVMIEPSLRTSMVARSPEETKESDEGESTTQSNLGMLTQAASEI
ncbi:hypothetical protein PHYSODRAFT_342523 [Phytophthora sojae]|uniref:Uncharacterized protein n=1 Tax=Phytophthora sojae (strain P6497) TaxID=1094619 RepID=G5AGV1_PHYSP|nr:hypothetical protein PHYSODRAFT_342523 [Phytophthora sojae]EGZ05144.1 hypothetical protein PHYSODRAFT_342523 [Phytophthora sojae]|eukprot:XP_009539302.1 hypothetical protein PHYSODRAFT_342523 [Phytophthora sojae]